jgi:1,4-dihydroxy-2-naphthoyl-CoA hydrolase
MIWKHKATVEDLNRLSQNTLVDYLGIEIIEIGEDYIKSKMPVDRRTTQLMGLLHGGASCVLSESMGSIAAHLCVDNPTRSPIVGIEINANHIKSAKSGFVTGITRPVKVGRTLQVWNTDIYNDEDEHICTSRLTVLVKSV